MGGARGQDDHLRRRPPVNYQRLEIAMHPGGANGLFADGSVRFINATIPIDVLAALISRAGGEAASAP